MFRRICTCCLYAPTNINEAGAFRSCECTSCCNTVSSVMLHSPSDCCCNYDQQKKKKNLLKLSINFVHLFLEFSTLEIKLECLRMVALNFMHLESKSIFRRITEYIDLYDGEYINLVKNTISSNQTGNYIFSKQKKPASKY